jgi:hypothetical protein
MTRNSLDSDEVGLTEAACIALMTYNQLLRLVCLGVVRGRKKNGRWVVVRQDVTQLREQRDQPKGEAGPHACQ